MNGNPPGPTEQPMMRVGINGARASAGGRAGTRHARRGPRGRSGRSDARTRQGSRDRSSLWYSVVAIGRYPGRRLNDLAGAALVMGTAGVNEKAGGDINRSEAQAG